MKIVKIGLVGLVILSNNAFAKKELQVSKYTCKSAEYKIENIRNKQRAGYSASQGERLREKLRLYQDLKDNCKKAKHPIK